MTRADVLICLFRMFKYYEFQDHLNILTRTLTKAWTDLYHFLFMFLIVFIGYAFLGHLLFGSSLVTYATLGTAIQAQWEMIMANYDYQSMYRLNPPLAAVVSCAICAEDGDDGAVLLDVRLPRVHRNVERAARHPHRGTTAGASFVAPHISQAYTDSVQPEDPSVPFSTVGEEIAMVDGCAPVSDLNICSR